MIVNAELFVKDLPGQLVGSLEPISNVDGNILGVVHNRDKIVNHRICLNVTFEVDEIVQLEKLKDIWKSKDIVISQIGSVCETVSMDYMLIGKIDAPFMDKLVADASKDIALESVDIRYSSKAADATKSSGMISVKAHSEDDLETLDSFFHAKCKEAGITYIRGI